jgi:Histidine kinase-, DNA gyrase B-, and HSP90-like ATPase
MKPDYDKIRSASTLAGETQRMTLDTNSLDHLMSVLTDLYSDPKLAVLREYATNAYDATVDAGSAEPVRVTLPSDYSPNLVIQDFGIGMNTDEILHVYSQYGNSTKRESDEVTGMLGVGCKSGLTYTNSFIVTTVKNGVKTVANVTKNTDNIGEIQIIDTASTNDRNGTTIQIPVRANDVSTFADLADTFFSYWTPGTVLVDGEAPSFWNAAGEFTKVHSDNEVYYKQHSANWYRGTAYLVMGNVTYPLSIEHSMKAADIVVFAPIGSVNFAPSREELSYRGKTDRYVESIAKVIADEIAYLIENAMKDATSKQEAMTIANRLRKAPWMPNGITFHYNGEVVPNWPLTKRQMGGVYWSSSFAWNKKNARIDRDPWSVPVEAIIISGKLASLSAAHKFGLRAKFGTDQGFFFTEDQAVTGNEWLTVLDWKELRKELPKPTITTVASSGIAIDRTTRNYALVNSYGGFTGDYYDATATANYLAFQPSNKPQQYSLNYAVSIGLTPIQIYKADFDEFIALPNVYTDIDTYSKQVCDSLTIEQHTTLLLRESHRINLLAITESLDTETAALVDLTVDQKVWEAVRRDKNEEAVKVANEIVAKYPLLNPASYSPLDQQIEYVNALYTTRKDS